MGSLNLSRTAFRTRGLDLTATRAHSVGTVNTQSAHAALKGTSIGCGTPALNVTTRGLAGGEPTLPAAQPAAFALAPNGPLFDAGAETASLANPVACLTSDAAVTSRPQSGLYGGPIRWDIGPIEFIGPMFRDGFEDGRPRFGKR